MDKLPRYSIDGVGSNIDRLAELFPQCVTEALDEARSTPERPVYRRAVNFGLLRQLLSPDIVEGGEAYEFTWPGKKAAIVEANTPTDRTLRPCPQESVDWDSTRNLYIEGDNLEVLKLLQGSYMGRVKMIYIDPPYNTGNDFIYRDDFALGQGEYDSESGAVEDGQRLVRNTDSNGRFHSDWCSMIYARLLLARNLLSDDGVIFISCDDSEQHNMRKMCDEIFGGGFIAQIIWERAFSPVNLKKHFSPNHDYIICYARDIDYTVCNGLPRTDEANNRYNNPDNDPRGPWTSGDLSVGPRVESRVYEITLPNGRKILPPSGYCWRLDKQTFHKYVQENRIWFGDGNTVPRIKRFLSEVKQGITPMTIWKYTEVGHSQEATKKLKELFDGVAVFDYPKSVELIKRCIQLYSDKDSIILDFFSGSATAAHAVMQLNAEDGGRRRFIMVQLPEACAPDSEAYRAGFANICEIGKERIRRAAKKIREDAGMTLPPDFDGGFRVLKLDEGNYEDISLPAGDYDQGQLGMMLANLRKDRDELDLLFGCLLRWNLPLSLPCKRENIAGCTVLDYNDGDLLACFDENVPETVIREMARRRPLRAVFKDSGFADSPARINVEEIFKLLSPVSSVKVL